MSTQRKDIVDRLNDLAYILNGDLKNTKNKYIQMPKRNQNRKLSPKKTKKSLKKTKQKITKHPNSENSETEENEYFQINNQQQIIEYDQNEMEYKNYEEEEEENEQYLSSSFDIDKEEIDPEYEENTEHIFKDEDEEDEENNEIVNNSSSPIRNYAIQNIRSDIVTFSKLTYFRKWRRAYHAKKIQISIANKMKKYKVSDKKKDDGIYKPCYYVPVFKKSTLEEQRDAIERLSKPRYSPNKNQNQVNEEEIKINHRRKYVRQIAHERDEKEKASKPISQKALMKAIDRLSLPKPKQEEKKEKQKPTITQREQFEISLRLSVPKKETDEEPVFKKTNKFILPTKKEQLEICDRLAQPKPDFSPKPIKHINRLTLAEQMEINERLTKTKKISKKRYDDDYSNDQDFNKNKKIKKGKKKSKKRSKKKIKTEENQESTFVSNQNVVLPTSPVPALTFLASPLNLNTPQRKVRFNGFQSGSKQKKDPNAKLLSQMIDEALSENDPRLNSQLSDDETTPNRRNNAYIAEPRVYSEKVVRPKKVPKLSLRSSSSNNIKQPKKESPIISNNNDDQKQKQNGQIFYHSLAEYCSMKGQDKGDYPSSDDGQKQSQDEVRYPSSEEDDQNQLKNEVNQSLDEIQFNSADGDDQNQLNNQSEVHISSFTEEEENIQEEVHFQSIQHKTENNKQDQINTEKVQHQLNNKEEDETESEAKPETKVENDKQNEELILYEEEEDEIDLNNFKLDLNAIADEEEDENNENENEEEADNENHSHFTSILKSSENTNNDEEDDDQNQDQDQFYFEKRPPGFNEDNENLIFEEEEEEAFVSDNLFEKEDNIRSQIPLRSRTPSYASLKSHHSINSVVESETLKEAQNIDMNKFVQENIFKKNGEEEEEDEIDDETAINENISGIEPIKGLNSNSIIEMHLFSKTLDSAQDRSSSDIASNDNI